MYLEEPTAGVTVGKAANGEATAPPRISKTLISALVCAVASVLLMRAGFLTFFFLVPLGVCAVVFGPAAAWLGAVFATLGNGLWSVGVSHAGLDTLFFAVLALGFTWIMAPNLPRLVSPPAPALPTVRTVFRFIAVSAAGALVFLAVIFSLGSDESFSTLLRSQIEAMASSYIATAGMDAVQRAYMEQTLTSDRIIEFFSMIMLRGGALVSALFLLFFNRQMAFLLARLFKWQGRRQQRHGDLIGFHAPRKAIWVLALCFPVIALCWTVSLEMIEIAVWNVLIMCAVMFFAQGGGIVLFNLARRPLPIAARLLGIVVLICVLFSPGINVLALLVLILLGIAENWFPLRVIKQEASGV